METTLDGIPDSVIRHCLSILANPKDFRALEKTCKRFRDLLQADELWKYCLIGYEAKTSDFRAEAFRPLLCQQIRCWQRSTELILNSVFTRRTHGISSSFFNQYIRLEFRRPHYEGEECYRLTGDAASVLMEIIEACLIHLLENASRLAIARCALDRVFPSVQKSDISHSNAELLRNINVIFRGGTYRFLGGRDQSVYDYDADSLEGQKEVNSAVRKLAFRAGIAKMDNNVYPVIWQELRKLTYILVRPGCLELANRPWVVPSAFRSPNLLERIKFTEADERDERLFLCFERTWLDHGQRIQECPPNPMYLTYEVFGPSRLPTQRFHTLVPRNITDAAKRIGLPRTTAYQFDWHVSEGTWATRDFVRYLYDGPGAEADDDLSDVNSEAYEEPDDEETEDEEYEYGADASISELVEGLSQQNILVLANPVQEVDLSDEENEESDEEEMEDEESDEEEMEDEESDEEEMEDEESDEEEMEDEEYEQGADAPTFEPMEGVQQENASYYPCVVS